MISIWQADLLRVLASVLTLINMGAIIAVLVMYRRVERAYPQTRGGLLVRHVLSVSISYLLLLIATLGEVLSNWGTPPTLYLPTIFLASGLGLWAMILVYAFEQGRITKETGKWRSPK